MCSSKKYRKLPYRRIEKGGGTGCYLFYQFSLVLVLSDVFEHLHEVVNGLK